MSDLLKGLTTGGWALLAGWMFPGVIVVSLFGLVVFPALEELPLAEDIASLSATTRVVVIAATGAALGILLHSVQTPLYRFLEGYTWPTKWQARCRRGELRRRAKLKTKAATLREALEGQAGKLEELAAANASDAQLIGENEKANWELGLVQEKLHLFPAEASQVAPTRLGNAFRAMETYGTDHYGLGAITLWTELNTLAPESLVKELDQARGSVDFFVAFIYLGSTFGLASFLTGLGLGSTDRDWARLAIGFATPLLVYGFYRIAVSSSSWYVSAGKALVNLGRLDLAAKLGLKWPATLDEERRMWERVTGFVFYDHDVGFGPMLDEFRCPETDGVTDEAETKG